MKDRDNQIIILISLIALGLRITFIDFKSGDYIYFLEPWVDYMKSNGGIFSLKDTFTNYNLPYITLLSIISYIPLKPLVFIKIISIIFDFIMAIYSYKIVKELVNKKMGIVTYIIVLLLPTVILNSGMWGQCDSIYISFILMSIYYLIKNKYIKSFIFLGISFAFKLQFVFILPLYIILFFIKKDIKIWHFLLIPLVNFILCIPGMLVGASPLYTYKIYFGQTESSLESLNVMNPYYYIETSRYHNFIGICITMTIFLFVFILCYKLIKDKFDNKRIITLGLLSMVICYFFLPCMHERYMYGADVLSVIWFIIYKRNIFIPIIINLCSLITYIFYLYNIDYFYMDLAYRFFPPFLLVSILLLVLELFNNEKKIIV